MANEHAEGVIRSIEQEWARPTIVSVDAVRAAYVAGIREAAVIAAQVHEADAVARHLRERAYSIEQAGKARG
jgi:hypothetical protein